MSALFGVLYWFGMVAMSLVLAAITVIVFLFGFKAIKTSSKELGISCIVFSVVAAGMVVLMVNKQFF